MTNIEMDTAAAIDMAEVNMEEMALANGGTFTPNTYRKEAYHKVGISTSYHLFDKDEFTFMGRSITYDQANDHILPAIERLENMMLSINELPEVEFDYDAYPINGFVADQKITKVLNGEYVNRTWMFYKESVPMVGLSITEALTHNLYPAYGDLFWDFVKHYSRDLETGDVIYTEYVK